MQKFRWWPAGIMGKTMRALSFGPLGAKIIFKDATSWTATLIMFGIIVIGTILVTATYGCLKRDSNGNGANLGV